MLRTAHGTHPPQLNKLFLRQYARKVLLFQPPPRDPPRKHLYPLTPSSLLAIYRAQSPSPALTLVYALRQPLYSQSIGDTLRSAQVSRVEYEQWAPIATAPTLASALDALERTLAASHPDPSKDPLGASALPPWVLLSTLCKTPVTSREAFVAHALASRLRPPDSPELFPLTVLLAAFWLSRFRMYAPLRAVVIRTLHAKEPLRLHDYQLALMLRILAQAQPSGEIQYMISLLLDLAINTQSDLGVRAYRAILENGSATGHIARQVEEHMKSRGYDPNLAHSRAFVRIYGRVGKRAEAARFWRRIRRDEYYGPKEAYTKKTHHQAGMLEDTLKAYKRPQKFNLYIKYLLKSAERRGLDLAPKIHDFDNPESEGRRTSALAPMLNTSVRFMKKVYMHGLRAASIDPGMPSSRLLSVFREGIEHVEGDTMVRWCYFTVIKGLMRRKDTSAAAKLLREIWEKRAVFNTLETTVAAEVLTGAGRPDVAFRLLLDLVPSSGSLPVHDQGPPTSEPAEPSGGIPSPQIFTERGRAIDTAAVNSFMISLLRAGRPDAVFFVWDTMPRVFGVEPNSTSVAIMLKAARFARKCEGAFEVAIADFGLGRVLPFSRVKKVSDGGEQLPQRLGGEDAVRTLEALLSPQEKKAVTGFWRGERAGVVALRVAWQILLGNWPVLQRFKAPVHAIRRSAGEMALSPMADLLHSLASGSAGDDGDGVGKQVEEDKDAGPIQPFDEDGRTYFGIVPEDAMFRALIDLLMEEDRAGEIPLVLTWMRYLHVWPSRDTLATALMYWGEVTFEGPWVQRLVSGTRGKGRQDDEGGYAYARLVKWVSRWVGKKHVPGMKETQKALLRVKWFREMKGFRTRRGEVEDDWSSF